MSKPSLSPPNNIYESQIIETLLAGLHQWRPDLSYPESHSDMQACVRALMVMYKVERRPLPEPLASPCPDCEGLGYTIMTEDNRRVTCNKCRYGKIYY